MKTSVKVISVLLTVVLCLSLLSVSAMAATFDCEMILSADYSQGNVVVRVSTNQAAGAVSGKLTFDSTLVSFDSENTVCYENAVDTQDLYTVEDNTITFAVLTDDFTNGTTQWIDFSFAVKGNGTATFSVSDAQAVDVNEKTSQAITVPPVSIHVGNGIQAWNLTLGDEIGVNFYVSAEDAANTKVSFTVAGKTSVVNASDAQQNDDGLYVFSTNVAAAQMTDPIAVEVLVNEEVIDSGSYTIRQYADVILSGNYTAKEKALVEAMLNYGGKAQLYFDYNTSALANTNITVTESDIPQNTESFSVSGNVDGLNFYGCTLVFRAKTAVRFYFKGDVTGCSFKAGETMLTPVEKDGLWYIEVADINPQDLDQPVTITVNDDLTVQYSPLDYIVRMNAKGSAELVALLKALYTYHLAAAAYVN